MDKIVFNVITKFRAHQASKIRKVVQEAQESDKIKVFLGGSCSNNDWRKNIVEKYGDYFFFIDPYDKNWDPKDNIYDELAGMVNSDYIVFYNGGDLTDKEKIFLELIDKNPMKIKSFDNIDNLEKFIISLKQLKNLM